MADGDDADDAPPAFCCPISFEVMTDPVFLVATGHTFERASIEAHLAKSSRCPLSGVDVTDRTLMPNHALRNAIEDYLSERTVPSAPPRTAADVPQPDQQPPMRPPPPRPHASRVPAAAGAAAASADSTGYPQGLKVSLTGVASKLAPAAAAAAGAAAAQAGRLAAAAASTATQRQMQARSTAAQGQAPAPAESHGAPAPATTRPSVAASILGSVRAGMIMAAEKLEAYADSANAQGGATNLSPAARPASASAQPSAAAAGVSRASVPAPHPAPQLMPLERMDTDAQIAAAIQLSLQDMGRACGDGQPGRGMCRVCRGGPVNNFCTQCGAPAR